MRYQIIALVLAIIIITFYFISFAEQGNSEDVVSVEQVQQMISDNDSILLIDVRTVSEYDGPLGHIPGAILVPLAELEPRITELEGFKESEIIVICLSGSRSSEATRLLRKNGFNAYNMTGGMLAWNEMLETTKRNSIRESDETISE